MKNRNWLREIGSIPNLLSLLRLVLIPVYVFLYFREKYILSGTVLALSCFTDYWDGWLARRFHMVTGLGKVLDPLADKATQLALFLCLIGQYPQLKNLLICFLMKEATQTALAFVFLCRGQILPGAILSGKISTAICFLTLILLVFLPGLPHRLVNCVIILDSIVLVSALIGYCFAYFGKHSILKKLE